MAVTIEWLLSQKALGTFELLAGARGVGNTITSVNIIDNPDTIRWLTEGELILSTGYLFQENVWMRNNTIQELAGRRCAGIGFVLKRYVDRLPEEMLEQADRLGFPIITVPYERSLAEVGRLIYRRIFEEDMTEMQQLSSLYRTLTEAAAKGGISGLLTGIVQVVGCPVLALSADFELLEYETLSAGTKSRLADFLHMEAGKPVFSEGIAHQIREKYARQRFVMTEQLLHRQEESLKLLCFAIAQGEDLLGYLCFPQDGSAFGTFEYNFVRTVEPIVAIELMRHIIHAKSKINI